MLFNSFDFLVFFVVVLGIQWVLPHRPRNAFLLGASCFFYACWDYRFLGLMLLSIAVNYIASLYLDRWEDPVHRRRLLILTVAINLGFLGFFKYLNFFADSFVELARRMGIELGDWQVSVVLPIGISFYTFQALSYVVDVYRRELKPLRSPIDFALFKTLFPQLVAGPIERGTHMAHQISRKKTADWEMMGDGCWLILKGLFKKAVIADNLAVVVDAVFRQENSTGPEVLLGVYAFAFQIYGDFAGYTDMARGVGKLLGYDLMLNFRVPYFAISPSDFWRRWHISLSSWLRDYLYIPLGGNRHGTWKTNRNLLLTMLLGGLWHGASWTFVVWGLYHGVLLILFRLFQQWRGGGEERAPTVGTWSWLFRVIVMFHLTCLGWLLFRAADMGQVISMLAALGHGWELTPEIARLAWQVALFCLPVIIVQFFEEWTGDLNFLRNLSLLPRAAAYACVLFAVLTIGSFGGREFIYFQF